MTPVHRLSPFLCALAIGVLAFSPSPAAGASGAFTASPPGVWRVYTDGNSVNALALPGGSGNVWAATAGGAVSWRGTTGSYAKLTTADGLANTAVTGVAVDAATGDKWFATHGSGVGRLSRPYSVFLPWAARYAGR